MARHHSHHHKIKQEGCTQLLLVNTFPGILQDLEHCATVRTGNAWLTAAAATPVSYNLCTASYARTINIYELQVNNLCSVLRDAVQA